MGRIDSRGARRVSRRRRCRTRGLPRAGSRSPPPMSMR